MSFYAWTQQKPSWCRISHHQLTQTQILLSLSLSLLCLPLCWAGSIPRRQCVCAVLVVKSDVWFKHCILLIILVLKFHFFFLLCHLIGYSLFLTETACPPRLIVELSLPQYHESSATDASHGLPLPCLTLSYLDLIELCPLCFVLQHYSFVYCRWVCVGSKEFRNKIIITFHRFPFYSLTSLSLSFSLSL